MQIFDVGVKFTVWGGSGSGSPTSYTLVLKRKAKSMAEACAAVSAAILSLSNVYFDNDVANVTLDAVGSTTIVHN